VENLWITCEQAVEILWTISAREHTSNCSFTDLDLIGQDLYCYWNCNGPPHCGRPENHQLEAASSISCTGEMTQLSAITSVSIMAVRA
jgi:hypothetical protein